MGDIVLVAAVFGFVAGIFILIAIIDAISDNRRERHLRQRNRPQRQTLDRTASISTAHGRPPGPFRVPITLPSAN